MRHDPNSEKNGAGFGGKSWSPFSSDIEQATGPPEILPTEIEGFDVIGVGSFGKVIKGKCRGKEVAIKILHKPISNFTDPKTLTAFKQEVAIMR